MAEEKEDGLMLYPVFMKKDEAELLERMQILGVIPITNSIDGKEFQGSVFINLGIALMSMGTRIRDLETEVAKLKGSIH